jgi:hypothetical protein
VCTSRQLVEFIVLDISPLNVDNGRVCLSLSVCVCVLPVVRGACVCRLYFHLVLFSDLTLQFCLAEVQVARTTDLGQNDIVYFTRTHLGRVLKPGDTCLGYSDHTCACAHSCVHCLRLPPVLIACRYLVSCVNFNDDDLRPLKSIRNAYIPDVVLVRFTNSVG